VRIVYRAIFLILAILLILFAVSNRGGTTVALWPLPFVAEAPLYLVSFTSLLFGILIGIFAAWVAARNKRRALRVRRRRIEALERELAATQAQLESPSPRTALTVGRQPG